MIEEREESCGSEQLICNLNFREGKWKENEARPPAFSPHWKKIFWMLKLDWIEQSFNSYLWKQTNFSWGLICNFTRAAGWASMKIWPMLIFNRQPTSVFCQLSLFTEIFTWAMGIDKFPRDVKICSTDHHVKFSKNTFHSENTEQKSVLPIKGLSASALRYIGLKQIHLSISLQMEELHQGKPTSQVQNN